MRKKTNSLLVVGLSLIVNFSVFSQESINRIQNYLTQESDQLKLKSADLDGLTVVDEHKSSEYGITFYYVQQQYKGIPIYNAISTFASQNDQLFLTGNRFEQNISERSSNDVVILNPREAIQSAALGLNLTVPKLLPEIDKGTDGSISYFSAKDLSSERIPVELMYFPTTEGKLIKVWDLSIYELSHKCCVWQVNKCILKSAIIHSQRPLSYKKVTSKM